MESLPGTNLGTAGEGRNFRVEVRGIRLGLQHQGAEMIQQRLPAHCVLHLRHLLQVAQLKATALKGPCLSLVLAGSKAWTSSPQVPLLTWEPLRKLPTARRVARMQRKVALCTSCSMPTFRSNSGSAISWCEGQGAFRLHGHYSPVCTIPSHSMTQVPAPCFHSPA